MPALNDIQLALGRINRALAGKRTTRFRDIRLGLERINKVVPAIQTWEGIHVAGTNGKGSICTYLAGLFKLEGIGYGSYTSPAFPESYNGVTIDGLYVNPHMYEMEKRHIQNRWNRISSRWAFYHEDDPETLSPFELETATAFRVFGKMHVPYGIVEVGMGGATDATNAMRKKAVTIISKIGLDHQEFLGNSIENIAKVKAGIMAKNVPCIVDHTNSPAVIRVLRQHAREVGTTLLLTWKAEPFLMTLNNEKWKLEDYQIQNLLCAALAFRHLFPHKEINLDKLLATEPYLPGRMETVQVSPEISGNEERNILVDGAHNMLGIEGLVSHVDKWVRKDSQPVSWVMGMSSSKTKPFGKMIAKVVQPQDNFAFVEFTQGPGDPSPAPANYGADYAKAIVKNPDQIYTGEPEVGAALQWACDKAGEDGPVVVTGSLYLVRDLFKLEGVSRKRELKTRRPGRGQLYRYAMIAQERKLTEEEEEQFKQARTEWQLSLLQKKPAAFVRDGEEVDEEEVDGEEVAGKESNGDDGDRKESNREEINGEKSCRREIYNAPEVLAEISELRRKATYHKTQAEGYRTSISVIQKDLEQRQSTDDPESHDDVLGALAGKLEGVKKLADNHREEYQKAMRQLRGRVPLSHKKLVGYAEIFKRRKRDPYIPPSSVLPSYVLPPRTNPPQPVEWPTLEEAEQEAAAGEEKNRHQRRRRRRGEPLDEESDPLVAEMVTGRR